MLDHSRPSWPDRPTVITHDPHAEPMPLRPLGSMLGDRFRIVNVFGGPGASGMGVVYVVEDGRRKYAAKTFQHQHATHLAFIERFIREAQTWILTGFHPNIVHAYFVDIIDAVPYLFMEFIEGDSHGAISLARRLLHSDIPMRTALDYAIQCCEGMHHATASVPGLVHRDLKPENLLISRLGALKITDFGLVRCRAFADLAPSGTESEGHSPNPRLTSAGSTMGTPAYMAPEQFSNAEAVTAAADIYAFGCCFYEAFTGRRIFTIRMDTPVEHLAEMKYFHLHQTPDPLRGRIDNCPAGLDDVIMACLEKDPGKRPASWAKLRERLIEVLEGLTRRRYAPRLPDQPSPRDVAQQVQSLDLLDGYATAVRRQTLRNSHFTSPYSFHLALASYFHCTGNAAEEQRQLQKATSASGSHTGAEVVRRLGDLFVSQGDWDEAERVIKKYLAGHPDDMDTILEPYVRLCIRRGEYGRAEDLLSQSAVTLRSTVLRAELYNAANRREDLAALLRDALATILGRLRASLAKLNPGMTAGWDDDGDWDALRQALAVLAPDLDTRALDTVNHCIWPELDGYPDFGADMAWLSNVCGRLSELGESVDAVERERAARCAEILGYPNRLRRHLLRDEHWIWANFSPG